MNDIVSDLLREGITWIRSIVVTLGPICEIRFQMASSPTGPHEASVTFTNVADLRIEGLGSPLAWNLSVVDVSERGLENVNWAITDPPMGRLAFTAATIESART